jgi:hypothetical protein
MNGDYLAFMLRLKRNDDRTHWRATLENAHTGDVHNFATEEELILFLIDRLNGTLPRHDLDADSEIGFE